MRFWRDWTIGQSGLIADQQAIRPNTNILSLNAIEGIANIVPWLYQWVFDKGILLTHCITKFHIILPHGNISYGLACYVYCKIQRC